MAPALDQMVLERLELVPVSSERLLLVFNLRSGVVRTIFVEVPGRVRPETVQDVARVLRALKRITDLTEAGSGLNAALIAFTRPLTISAEVGVPSAV